MHYYPFYSPFAPELLVALIPLLAIVAIWTVIIKGFALWYAARGSQKWWFIALLFINTLGILEIVYLLWFRPGACDTYSHATPKKSS
ncbi:MAG: DUF5652 family protein [Patescibacteria group bacterium]|nr:DUF5652 family protein [Patescibacteria group bacterium]